MRSRATVVLTLLGLVGCGGKGAPPAADSAAVAKQQDDSILALHTRQAPALADSARTTMAVLLKHPESAVFDSLIVVQPPKENGEWPSPYVCGRIGGKPGIGGKNAMTPFIYANRLTVFVLDEKNGPAFASVRAKDCDIVSGQLLLK